MKMKKLTVKDELSTLFSPPGPNEVIDGTVLGQERLALFVDLGPFGTGIVYGKEFFKAKKLMGDINKGDKVKAKILELDGRDEYSEVSITKALEEAIWKDLEERKKERTPFEVVIKKANRGGLIAEVKGIQGFIPVSHLRPEHYPKVEGGNRSKIESMLEEFVGETMKVVVLNLDREEHSLILSEKEANTEEIKEVLEQYNEGDVVQGQITGVVEFGAFIRFPHPPKDDIQSIEGLIHISELDWQLIEDPRDIVKEGDSIEAKIIDISKGRISLSLKALKEDPWQQLPYEQGDVIKGEVTKFNPFGAFVQVAPKVQGLIHISEFDTEEEMQKEVKVGEEYSFEIELIDREDHRMILKLDE